MGSDIILLCGTAASIGFIHTLLGPDHYLPFIALARARSWSLSKTAWITSLCGIGHVLSSVVLGLLGAFLGIRLVQLAAFEAIRGSFAAWLLIGFGFAYLVWGIRRAWRDRPHRHLHVHQDFTVHVHTHRHHGEHAHVHDRGSQALTPWVLFVIFVLGPCELLIPLLMYPAAEQGLASMFLVASVFGAVTVGTMLAVVLVGVWGVSALTLGRLEPYGHALAGATVLFSGLGIQVLGL